MFEIENNLNNPISSFSHGMKQKIAIIAALSHNPKILIMDDRKQRNRHKNDNYESMFYNGIISLVLNSFRHIHKTDYLR